VTIIANSVISETSIDDFRQSLSRKGPEHLLWVCVQGFKTYLLTVTSQALLFYLMVQLKAAPNR
jgi:hypothetical protein